MGRRSRRLQVVLLLVLGLLLAGCGGSEIPPPRAPKDDTGARTEAATRLLQRLQAGLRDGDRSTVSALAAPDAASRAAVAAIYDNARALGLTDETFRFVDQTGATGGRRWDAAVEVGWRLPVDADPTSLTTRMRFETADGRTRLVAAGVGDERSALWLTGPVEVSRGPSSLAMAAEADGVDPVGRYGDLARQAVLDVRQVLPDWRGELVVEVPASEQALERLLHAKTGEYRQIAAVTTTVDGSQDPGSPVHVFVNPQVFDRLGPRGAQVVLSHETTHVASRATFDRGVPLWLTEGFADFVALAHADIPVSTAASQILARVRKDGPPQHLPTPQDLDPSATGLGATYEEAWTVCRLIGLRYGQQQMVDFYEAVQRGASTRSAFRTVLGTTQADFVRAWTADLATLAAGRSDG